MLWFLILLLSLDNLPFLNPLLPLNLPSLNPLLLNSLLPCFNNFLRSSFPFLCLLSLDLFSLLLILLLKCKFSSLFLQSLLFGSIDLYLLECFEYWLNLFFVVLNCFCVTCFVSTDTFGFFILSYFYNVHSPNDRRIIANHTKLNRSPSNRIPPECPNCLDTLCPGIVTHEWLPWDRCLPHIPRLPLRLSINITSFLCVFYHRGRLSLYISRNFLELNIHSNWTDLPNMDEVNFHVNCSIPPISKIC